MKAIVHLDSNGLRRGALALIVAVAGSAGLTAFAQPDDAMGPGGGGWHHHHAGPPGGDFMMMGGPGMQHMLDAVDATTEQRGQIKQIFAAAMTDLRAQHQAASDLRGKGMQLFAQPTVDAAAAESLRQQMLAQHDQASKRMLQAMLDVSKVLTPAQRAKLADMAQKRQQRMQERAASGTPAK